MNKNVIKYRRDRQFNIGYVIFFIILIFLLFKIYTYFTSEKIAEYEVTQGTIATNKVYRGMILRNESVVTADKPGYINYYIKNGTKVSANDIVYSIDSTGEISKKITNVTDDGSKLSDTSLLNIIEDIDGFTNTYSSISFSKAYTFKQELQSELNQTLSTTALNSLDKQVTSAENNKTFSQYTADKAGVVSYYIDGYEDTTVDNFKEEYFSVNDYSTIDLSTSNTTKTSNPVYKLISTENWNILLPVTKSTVKQLKDKEGYVKIRICKDDYTQTVNYKIQKRGKNYYALLSLNKAMIRYIADRYIDVELIINEDSGLKIPNSSITEKDFFAIPKDFVTKGGDNDEYSLMLVATTDGPLSEPNLITPDVYKESQKYIYIDGEQVKAGDVIAKNNMKETYKIGTDFKKLTGVYNINKGYALFRQIEILTQNEDYTIINTRTKLGLALYDHIALDGSKVHENQTIVK